MYNYKNTAPAVFKSLYQKNRLQTDTSQFPSINDVVSRAVHALTLIKQTGIIHYQIRPTNYSTIRHVFFSKLLY